jgi:N-acetylmuramoyl-L-alanine amidase
LIYSITFGDMLKIIDSPSPNFNERGGQTPDYMILHYTDMLTAQAAIDRLCDPAAQVSAHYLVDEQGAITRMVQEDKRAWHAGVSCFDGITDFNARSIGIELANPGHTNGYKPFPEAQMLALIALCRDILTRQRIPARNVLAHSDIAPARKQDPGELFDWARLAGEGIGVWPEPEEADYDASAHWVDDTGLMMQALEKAGYDGKVDPDILLIAFQRHFQPEVFRAGEPESADAETAARIYRLAQLRI